MTPQYAIRIARVYDAPDDTDGARLLVDRLWPRGLRKQALGLDAWIREVAPSPVLRSWFGHDPAKWDEFSARYGAELVANAAAVETCLDWCRQGRVVLLTAARARAHSHAIVLRDHLCDRLQREQKR